MANHQAIPLEELSEETREQLGINKTMLPEKWVVHAKVMLLLSSVEVSDAKWIVNKIRRDLERLKVGKKKRTLNEENS